MGEERPPQQWLWPKPERKRKIEAAEGREGEGHVPAGSLEMAPTEGNMVMAEGVADTTQGHHVGLGTESLSEDQQELPDTCQLQALPDTCLEGSQGEGEGTDFGNEGSVGDLASASATERGRSVASVPNQSNLEHWLK